MNKRLRTQRFILTMEDYDQDDINFTDTSSMVSESDQASLEDRNDSEPELFSSDLIENRPKKKVTSPSKTANVVGSSQLTWGNVNQKLDASDIPFQFIKVQKSKNSKKSDMEKVVECFQVFFTSEMIDLITNASNQYAESKKKAARWANFISSKKISSNEMIEYLGIRLANGIIRCSEYRDMYSNTFPFNFREVEVMPKSRFEFISSSLHCQYSNELEQSSGHPTSSTSVQHSLEQVGKIGKLLKAFRDVCYQCPKYEISRELTLDEMMVRFQGRSAMVYHRQPKPTSVGIKVVSLTDPNGFLLDFLVLKGPGKSMPVHELIMYLVSGLPKGHVVYMDNYFGSIKTALSLLEKDIMICCTLRKNKGVPTEKELDPSTSTHGQCRYVMSNVAEKKNIIVGHWHDSKIMSFLSTFHDGTMCKIERKRSGSPTKVKVSCPKAIEDYNLFMHGNDRADQMRKSFSIQTRAKKWWKPLFNFIFDSACINAYLYYRQRYGDGLGRKQFMILLCNWMCKINQNVLIHNSVSKSALKVEPTIKHVKELGGSMIGNHLISDTASIGGLIGQSNKGKMRGYCMVHKMLGKKERCELYCYECREYFHFNCYKLYHLKNFLCIQNNKITSF